MNTISFWNQRESAWLAKNSLGFVVIPKCLKNDLHVWWTQNASGEDFVSQDKMDNN